MKNDEDKGTAAWRRKKDDKKAATFLLRRFRWQSNDRDNNQIEILINI